MNYLSLSSIFGTTTPGEKARDRDQTQHSTSDRDNHDTPTSTMTMGESPASRLNSTPLSSLRPITTRSRTNSTTSLSSLPSCVSLTSIEATPGIPDHDDGTSSHNADYAPSICSDQGQYRRKSMTRRASTSMLPTQCLHGVTMDDRSKIKVTCNNCYLWRKKCSKQDDKIRELQSELDRVKMDNMELLNKNNLNTKTYILQHKEMNNNLNDYKQEIKELKQLNEDQSNKINDMKHENEALKEANTNLREENKSLHDDVEETKEKGRKALIVINKLKEKVLQIQAQIKNEDSAEFQDAKNPWSWVLRMT